MPLFQTEEVTQAEFDKQHKPDIFSKLGYDDIINERQNIRNQRIEDEKRWVQNIVSPDRIKSWQDKGQMSAIEMWHKKDKSEIIPYAGSWKEGSKAFNIKDISDKLAAGQTVTPKERKQFEDYVLNLAEVQTRGYTIGGMAVNIGLQSIPFAVELGVGLLTTGGVSSFGASMSKLGAAMTEKGIAKTIGKGIAKTAYNASLNPKTYAFTATRLPQQVRARTGDILLSDSLAVSPEGQVILKESETNPALAFMKALALTNIEVASEMSAQILVRPVMDSVGKLGLAMASPIAKRLPKGFADSFVKLAEKVTNMPFLHALDKLGWNGILEEIGEERVGDLLQAAFNLNDKEGYSFEQFLDAMFPGTDQLASEAISFGLTGVGMHGLHSGLKSLPGIGEKYTKDGFLLDAGIFRVKGYDSYLDSKVKATLEEKGKDEDEINNALQFSNRDDKIQFLKNSKTEFDSKEDYDAKEFEKDLRAIEYEDKTYEKLANAGVKQDIAYAASKLMGVFARNLGVNKQAFDDWYNKLFVTNKPANEVNKDGTQFQSAAMYNDKSSSDVKGFYNNVKNNPKTYKKAKYAIPNHKLSIPADVITHDEKHKLTADDWNNIVQNIDDIFIAGKTNDTNSFSVNNYRVGIKTPNGEYYGLVLGLNDFDNYICTAFKNTKKGVEAFVNESGKISKKKDPSMMPTSQPLAPKGNNTSSVVSHSPGSNNIISYVKERIKSNDVGSYFQSTQSAGINKNSYLQNNGKKAIDNFYNKHAQHIEKEPEKYTGSRKIKDVLKFLGSKDGKKAVIKTPAGDVTITESDIRHLVKDNETERLGNLNKVVSTLKNPNIVINAGKGKHNYNYYIKAFNGKTKNKAHLQVIKLKDDGNFYVTNYHLRNNLFEQILKQGQIIYDLTHLTAPTENNSVPVSNSITDNGGKINPNVKNGNTYFQSAAMYKSPKENFEEFYNQVQADNNPKQKAYFTQKTKGGVSLDIFHDVVKHDNNKHSLTKEDWINIFNSIDKNIKDKILAKRSYYKGVPILLKIKTKENYYGVSLEIFPNRNIITTAFKSTNKGVNAWFKQEKDRSARTTAPNHQSGSSITKSNNVIPGQTLNNIIQYVKDNLNPNVNNSEDKTYFQSAGINKNSYLQNNGKKAIDNFYNKHAQHIEKEPEKYTGSRKIKDVLKFLGSKDGKKAVIKTPAGDVTITKSNVNHLTKDNETERLGNLNKVVSTLKNPNIIININENGNYYNYYIKAFKGEKQNKVHTQIIKLKSDGNFYVTNFDLRNNKFEKLLKQGQIIYDSTLYTTAPTENNSVPVNNIITDNGGKINPNVKNGEGNIYYQSANNEEINSNVVDLTNDFEKTPSLEDVKKYINQLIQEGVKFATSSPGWFVDIKGGKRIKNKILNAANYKNLDKMERKRHNKYVMSLEKLLSNAVHTGEKENTKKDKKPNVEKYHYFKTTAKIGNKTYEIIFDTEEYKNDKTASVGHAKRDLKETEADTNSITDNREKVNPKTVHLYNITELKQANIYYQSTNNTGIIQSIKNYKNFVNKVFNKKLTKAEKSKLFEIGKTPQKLVEAGIPQNNIAVGYKIIEKAQDNRNKDHNLSKETISNVYEALYNPIVVIKAEQNKNETTPFNRYAVIVDLQNDNGNYVVVSIEADKNKGSGNIINDIRSIHSRSDFTPMIEKAIDENRLLKVSKEKIKDLSLANQPDIISGGEISQKGSLLGNQPDIISGGGQVNLIGRINQYDKNVKVYFQEANEDERLIAGFTYQEVMDKLSELYTNLDESKKADNTLAKIHILENAFEISEHPEKFNNEDKRHETMLNAYYIMNNQEIPEDYIEADARSQRSYNDLLKLHNEKKEKAQEEYYGYFAEGQQKNTIGIMQYHNPSTIIHEMGHLFLNGLNELADTGEKARECLEAVNKWLGASNGIYTAAQHEKFARSFEAYLYKGKAPSNKLKQVFESFKQWLRAVYIDIAKIPSADISPEAQELFDKIFSDNSYYEERKGAGDTAAGKGAQSSFKLADRTDKRAEHYYRQR